ncbi:hypothetical protein ASF61_02705 [Duganella sp. Leaf126]|nr:hypothetical protein ASF61_02705 [Duganella sp. Leaf126]
MYLRSGLALLCGAILSACGGSSGDLQLSGTINGYTKKGLQLVNNGNGETLDVTDSATSFVFTRRVSVDDNFDIQVSKQPANATCVPSSNQGRANVYNAYTIVITCTNVPRTLGGSISGLTSDGLVIANGTDTVTVARGATSFVFPHTVGDGSNYGINILTQPAGQTCTIPAGTGTGNITGGDLTNAVTVSCVNTSNSQ